MALEMDAGLTWRCWASWDAVRLPVSVVNRQVSTRAGILVMPEAMRTVVRVSSYAATASALRPCGWGADAGPWGVAGLRRWARCSVARWARSAR
ncbi:hypothetical protein SO3561_10620 [Streptomyces olivochromogenes]|uniref:Uncharacterized protein n=1 Tax=Streptomyces olivochromogenes TaxID=1963 RepID=A0A286TT55_STROL|nr:hypothetical protein SO3561_10620 [Streptomyces olivochromogenes]